MESTEKKCEGCDKIFGYILKKCSNCKKSSYCSSECQKNHWKIHKPQCDKDVIEMALIFATEKHKDKAFNDGPYINHLIRVSDIIKEFTTNAKIISVTLLYNIFENTNAINDEIENIFCKEIFDSVISMTNLKLIPVDFYNHFSIMEKMIKMSKWQLLILLAFELDKISNLSRDDKDQIFKTDTIISLLYNPFNSKLSNPNIGENHIDIIIRIKRKILNHIHGR